MPMHMTITTSGVGSSTDSFRVTAGWGCVVRVCGAKLVMSGELTDSSDEGRKTKNRAALRANEMALNIFYNVARLKEVPIEFNDAGSAVESITSDPIEDARFTLRSDSRLVINTLRGLWNSSTHRDLWPDLHYKLTKVRDCGPIVRLRIVRGLPGDGDYESADELSQKALRGRVGSPFKCLTCSIALPSMLETVRHISTVHGEWY